MSDTIQSGTTPLAGFEFATAMTSATLHAMSEWNRELGRFFGHRLEMDAQLQEELSHCTRPFEAIELCSRFVQTAVGEYAEEAQKLQEISAHAATENMAALEPERKPNGGGSAE